MVNNLFDRETRTIWPITDYCKSWVLMIIPSVTMCTTCQFLGHLLSYWCYPRKTQASNHTWQHALHTTYFTEKRVRTRVCFAGAKIMQDWCQLPICVFALWVKNYIYKSRRATNFDFWLRWLFCFHFHRLRCIPQGLRLPKAKRYLHQCLRPAAPNGVVMGKWALESLLGPWKLGPRRLKSEHRQFCKSKGQRTLNFISYAVSISMFTFLGPFSRMGVFLRWNL